VRGHRVTCGVNTRDPGSYSRQGAIAPESSLAYHRLRDRLARIPTAHETPMPDITPTRRDLLLTSGAALLATSATAAEKGEAKVYRIGVVPASIGGKPQKTNGHTWHFAQYLHPTVNLDIIKKYLDPGSADIFRRFLRNPKTNFDVLPFPDTRITHVYDADPTSAAVYAEAFPGVQVARKLEDLVAAVDAVWMGDASGRGEDHYDLVAPGLEKGLPTFCAKPIAATAGRTRKLLDLARKPT